MRPTRVPGSSDRHRTDPAPTPSGPRATGRGAQPSTLRRPAASNGEDHRSEAAGKPGSWPRTTRRRDNPGHEDHSITCRQGALAAATPPLDIRVGHRARRCRCRRDGARRVQQRRVPGLGGLQPGIEDPGARMELRGGPAHRRGFLRRRLRCRNRGPQPLRHPERCRAVGAWRIGRTARSGGRPLCRHAGCPVSLGGRRAMETCARRCPFGANRIDPAVRALRYQHTRPGGPARSLRVVALRRPDRPRAA